MTTKHPFRSARAELECAFAPFACSYQHDQASVRLRLYERETNQTQLVVAGIPFNQLSTRQNLAKLVDELRHELDGTVLRL